MASEKPESILLASHLWLWVVGLEVVHQILNVIMGILAPEQLIQQLKEQPTGQQPPLADSTINTLVYAVIVAVGLFGVAIMCVVLWMALVLSRGGTLAVFARRTLLFFGVYLGVRLLFVFVPNTSNVSVAWIIVDGCVQIAVGVLAVLAVYLITRKESLHWTGENHG